MTRHELLCRNAKARGLFGVFGHAVWTVFFLIILGASFAAAQGSEADVFVAQAVLAYEDKRYEEALLRLREALDLDPENIDALYYTGLVLIAQQKKWTAVEPLEKAREKAPDDLSILFQLGVVYFSLEEYGKAEPVLTQVFDERPRTANVGYYVGFMRYRQKDYQGAVQAFAAGASTDPNIQQLTRFYAGLALAILGLPERAASELEEASRIRTVSPLTAPAERLRDTLVARRERERRLRGQIRLGAFYDTNVSVNPLASGDPTAESLRSRKANSPGELAAVHLEYSWLRTGAWEATAGYTFLQTINNDNSAFNIQNHLGSVAGFYRGLVAAMPFQLGAQYAFDFVDIRDNRFLDRQTTTAFATLVENAGNVSTVLGRYQLKDFSNQFLITGISAQNRDATNWMVGFTHIFRFAADKHLIRIGYQYDRDDAEGSDWTYLGHRALAGAQYTLPWGDTRLIYNFDFHRRDYSNPNSTFPVSAPNTVSQVVEEQNHVFRVERPLPYNLTLAADFQATISRSNIDVTFNFNREIGTLSLVWTY